MPRRSVNSKYYPSNQLMLFLEEKPEWILDSIYPMLLSSEIFYCRVLEHFNRIDFGLKKGFDRWANSTEYFYDLKDYEINSYEAAFERADYAYKTGLRNTDFTPICLNEISLRKKK